MFYLFAEVFVVDKELSRLFSALAQADFAETKMCAGFFDYVARDAEVNQVAFVAGVNEHPASEHVAVFVGFAAAMFCVPTTNDFATLSFDIKLLAAAFDFAECVPSSSWEVSRS